MGRVRSEAEKETGREATRRNRRAQKAIRDSARDVPCKLCGHRFPSVCMDFHHRDPSTKLFGVGAGTVRSMDALLAEIAKCDVYCANCHRIIEHIKEA